MGIFEDLKKKLPDLAAATGAAGLIPQIIGSANTVGMKLPNLGPISSAGKGVTYQGVPLPELKDKNPQLYEALISQNPELLQDSAMQGISLDPRQRQAQLNALQKFQDIGDAGGRDAQFISQSNQMQNDLNANLQGNTGAIQQNMAARGMSGGMSEMVQKQIAAQQSANRQAQMGQDLNAQAQQRALSALSSGAALGGNMNEQQFSQQAAKAQAADAINRFNVGAKNTNTNQNWQNQQNIKNQNTDVTNARDAYNKEGGKAKELYGLQTGQAKDSYQAAKDERERLDRKWASDREMITGLAGQGIKAFTQPRST
jgi:hypothetical protein